MSARAFGVITADAIRSRCGHCWAEPGIPCPGGTTHLARYQRALRKGLISAQDMTVVIASVIASEVPFLSEAAA